jgi:DNA-binding FadR family transcriptional regulator
LPSERSLSNQFKVSRASLREAITALEVAGIVLVKPGNGIFLSENVLENIFKISDISASFSPLEILEARSLIEPNIAGLAAERRAHKDLASLREANELMEFRLNEDLDSWDADWGFHEALVKATQNLSKIRIQKKQYH